MSDNDATEPGLPEPDFSSFRPTDRLRVIVTRPIAQALPWLDLLNSYGVEAYPVPLIDIEPMSDVAPLVQAWHGLSAYALVMFVSANAVQHFFAQQPAGRPWPSSALAASTGPGTTAALQQVGLRSAMIVEPAQGAGYDSEALWARLSRRNWSGSKVLLVRGESGRDWLADQFREAGAEVSALAAYRRLVPAHGEQTSRVLSDAIETPSGFCWLFTSSEAVGHLIDLASTADWSQSHALVTHLRIAQAARAAGFRNVQLIESQPLAVVNAVRHMQHLPPVA